MATPILHRGARLLVERVSNARVHAFVNAASVEQKKNAADRAEGGEATVCCCLDISNSCARLYAIHFRHLDALVLSVMK